MAEPEIVSRRGVPDDWPQLIGLAQEAVPELDDIRLSYAQAGQRASGTLKRGLPNPSEETTPRLWALTNELHGLDRAALDQNLYYGLSLAICRLARELRQPEARERITQEGADLLISGSVEVSGGISALRRAPMKEAFVPSIVNAYQGLPPEARLLGDVLTIADSQREKMSRPMSDHELSGRQIAIAAVSRPPWLVRNLRGAVISGASSVCDGILIAKAYPYRLGYIPNQEVLGFLRDASVRQVAQSACALSIEDIKADRPEYVSVDGRGAHFINTKAGHVLPAAPDDLVIKPAGRPRSWLIRDESIVCPAAHVNAMVPLVMDMTVDMIDLACDRLEAVRTGRTG